MNNNKDCENEKDINIITLPNTKLQIFSPPSTIGQTSNYMCPRTPNLNITSNSLFDPERTNFTFCSKIEYLGAGGFSKVYKYRGDLENKAVKKIFADPKYYSKKLTAEDSIKREVFGMKKINCNNSLKVFGVYQNEEKNTYYLLLELCDGNMEKYIKDRGSPLNTYETLNLLNQLNQAFYLLEINNIIHRDIKPSNILYKEEKNSDPHNKRINKKLFDGKKLTFKLGDYGVCLPLYDQNYSKSQFMGTLDFMAPEIYEMKCEKEHPIYTKKIDLFALGQSILCLMGYIQKASALNQSMIDELKEKCNLFEGNRKEKMLADLIFNYLLIVDPEKRADWMTYFNHPIFEDYNVVTQVKDENIKRVEKRYIKRNSTDTSKAEIPKNNRLFKYTKENNNENKNNENKGSENKGNENKGNENKVNGIKVNENKVNEKKANENKIIELKSNKNNNSEKEQESIIVYGKSFKINNSNNNSNEKDTNKININIYNKHKTHKVLKENLFDKKFDNIININLDKDKNNFHNNKNKSTSNITNVKDIKENNKEKNQLKILNIEKVKGLENKEDNTNTNTNSNIIYNQNTKKPAKGVIKDIKIKYIKNNFNIKKNRVLPFDASGFNIEKKKTYTNPKTNGIISITNLNKENNKNNKSIEKNKGNKRYYEYDKNNFNNNNNDNNNKEEAKSQIILFSNNKSHKYLNNFRNNSNSNEIINKLNKKDQEKTAETQNHFFSVRNKYKSLANKKENFIRKNLTNMKLEPEKKENIIVNKKTKIFIKSQNFSPKSIKNIDGIKFNSVYEGKTTKNNSINVKSDKNDKRINYFQNEKGDEKIDFKDFNYAYPRNTIKLHKIKMNQPPENRFSKSHAKYNNNYTFNKNNMTMCDANYKIHIGNNFNSNITVTEANHKPNISTDLTGEASNNYNKISYIFNSNNLKNKSITYFNIRVVNNQVEENLNKINKNNAFYFSKYSRYNQNY